MYVLMITPNKFPEGDAGAVRDGYFAKIYQDIGYDVVHIGMDTKLKEGNYKNIIFYSLYRPNSSLLTKITNTISYKKRLEEIVASIRSRIGNPSLIHIYDLSEAGIVWAKKIAVENSIPIIHDSVEWYSPCEFKQGRFAYPYLMKQRTNTKLIDKPVAVIAISSYLEKHFKQKGLKTIRIPVIMDSLDYSPKQRSSEKLIKLVYAGSPAKKDYLKECIIAFKRLEPEVKSKFEFTILGADSMYVEQCCSGDVPKEITAYGRVPRKIVISKLEENDFSLLLRPDDERYAKAGFPTKSVEAMMNGCAMICNLTSDLGMYLKDGKNAIIVERCTIEAMYQALLRVSELNNEQIDKLKEEARRTAEMSFDFRIYTDKVEEFIDDIQK